MGNIIRTHNPLLTVGSEFITAGSKYIVETISGNIYNFTYTPSPTAYGTINYSKSTDKAKTWNDPVFLRASTNTISYISVYYDRWSNINADLIHILFVDDTTDDVIYMNLNTSTDVLSAEVVVFNASSTAVDGFISIARMRGGNLIAGGCVDAGEEPFFKKSTDVGVNWSDIANAYEATTDQLILLPGFATDTNDAICIYWDASANEISRKLYDDSGNSWGETSISGSMVDLLATIAYPNFSAAIDLTNSQIVLVAWENTDTVGADLKCWTVTEGAITAKSDVVTASSDDQGLCFISIDTVTNYLTCFYCGKSDGSETWLTSLNIYYKISQDGGTTWGDETKLSLNTCTYGLYSLKGVMMTYFTKILLQSIERSPYNLAYWKYTYVINSLPRTTYQLGL